MWVAAPYPAIRTEALTTVKSNMVKLQFDKNQQFKITLPKPIMLAKGWVKGDELVIELDKRGDLVLRKRK